MLNHSKSIHIYHKSQQYAQSQTTEIGLKLSIHGKWYSRIVRKINVIQQYSSPSVIRWSWNYLNWCIKWNTENQNINLTYTIGGKTFNFLSSYTTRNNSPIMQRIYMPYHKLGVKKMKHVDNWGYITQHPILILLEITAQSCKGYTCISKSQQRAWSQIAKISLKYRIHGIKN